MLCELCASHPGQSTMYVSLSLMSKLPILLSINVEQPESLKPHTGGLCYTHFLMRIFYLPYRTVSLSSGQPKYSVNQHQARLCVLPFVDTVQVAASQALLHDCQKATTVLCLVLLRFCVCTVVYLVHLVVSPSRDCSTR